MQFDLVSDLHIEHHGTPIDWHAFRASNPNPSDIIVVAGDVASNAALSVAELGRIADVYETVLFVDGNHEHGSVGQDMPASTAILRRGIAGLPNVHFLPDGVYIKDCVAFVGRNGWWDFRFGEPYLSYEKCLDSYNSYYTKKHCRPSNADHLLREAFSDAVFLATQVKKLQKDDNVREIVIVTHTLPHPDFITWPAKEEDRANHIYAGGEGSLWMQRVFEADYKKKIRYACFGHDHKPQTKDIGHVTAISNPRGRPNDAYRTSLSPVTLSLGSPTRPQKIAPEFPLHIPRF